MRPTCAIHGTHDADRWMMVDGKRYNVCREATRSVVDPPSKPVDVTPPEHDAEVIDAVKHLAVANRRTIADATGLMASDLRRSIQRLVRRGLLVATRHHGGNNGWRYEVSQ